MQMPNWLKAVWWGFLTAALTYFLLQRVDDAIEGKATAADILVFIVWFALLLVPLFSEIELFGVKLKKEIREASEKITREISALRLEISNAVDVRTSFSPNIYLNQPPPDSQLPKIEARIKKALAEEPESSSELRILNDLVGEPDERTLFAFRVRRALDVEIKRIAREAGRLGSDGSVNIHRILRSLVEAEILDAEFEPAIRDLYRVCSPAVHGDNLTPTQYSFIREVAPAVLSRLHHINVGDLWFTAPEKIADNQY